MCRKHHFPPHAAQAVLKYPNSIRISQAHITSTPPNHPNPTMSSQPPSTTCAWQSADIVMRYQAVENATRPFAAIMVAESQLPSSLASKPAHIFDLGCGTGAVEAEIYRAVPGEQWRDVKVLAGDISEPMVGYLEKRGGEEGWTGLETRIVDGKDVGSMEEGGFSHVFLGFAVFMLPGDALVKLGEKLAKGGVLGVSTWAQLAWYGLLGRTYERMEDGPVLPSPQELWSSFTDGRAWNDVAFVKARLEEAGLERVHTVQRKFNVDCGTPDLFMTTMGFMLGMLSKQWPEEKREKWSREVAETMMSVVTEDAGGADKHFFLDFEGIVGVGWKKE